MPPVKDRTNRAYPAQFTREEDPLRSPNGPAADAEPEEKKSKKK